MDTNQIPILEYAVTVETSLIKKYTVCPQCGAEVKHRMPIVALVLSMIIPGLGQIYNDQTRKGIILIIVNIISAILILIAFGLILTFMVWVYAMYDAYKTAQALNRGDEVDDRILGII